MPKTAPLPDWTGTDAFVIGGGPSLRGFDWTQLHGHNTVGCNHAFLLGADVCSIATFGDYRFWVKFGRALAAFPGWVATNYLLGNNPEWVHFFKRIDDGLGVGDALAWNNNTGCLATNIALMLGARRVFLLGIDCDDSIRAGMDPVAMGIAARDPARKTHWHDESMESQNHDHYRKFRGGFGAVAAALPGTYPDRQIINVHNGTSTLTAFPSMTFGDAHLKLAVPI